MTELDDFLILPMSTLDQLLAKSSHTSESENLVTIAKATPGYNSIDELGLLPGSSEANTISGYIEPNTENLGSLHFAPLSSQEALLQLQLKADGTDLTYRLSENQQQLIATAGHDGPNVFHVDLKEDGTYFFTLDHPIDRSSTPNLTALSSWQTENDENSAKISQLLATEPNMPYQFTLQYLPGMEVAFDQLQIYWDQQLLRTIPTSQQDAKGYTFSVEGNLEGNHTLIEIVGIGGVGQLNDYIKDVTVASAAQFQLPIDFVVLLNSNEYSTTQSTFTVNVTTTPAIELGNQNYLDISYEQSVYQTIIVNNENAKENPLATLNLDSLFKQLSIEQDNRLVEVVQRSEDGIGTNVYEVQISDKMRQMTPITIADVQLSFPGGDGGMTVFERHITIHDGSTYDALPILLDIV